MFKMILYSCYERTLITIQCFILSLFWVFYSGLGRTPDVPSTPAVLLLFIFRTFLFRTRRVFYPQGYEFPR